MVSLVDLVYLVCLVERDKPDERNRPDEPVLRVSLGYPANKTFPVSIPGKSYSKEPMRRPTGVGGVSKGGGGEDPAGMKVATLLLPDS